MEKYKETTLWGNHIRNNRKMEMQSNMMEKCVNEQCR